MNNIHLIGKARSLTVCLLGIVLRVPVAMPNPRPTSAGSWNKDGLNPMPMSSPEPSPRYVWYVIGILVVVNIFSFMDRTALAVLAPLLKAELHFSDSKLGLLLGFAFAIFYALCAFPIARWADRGNRRNIIALALGTWSVMTALSGAAQQFWHLFLARVGVGAGEAGGLPPAQSLLCDYVQPNRRSGVLAMHTAGSIAGSMVGFVLAGWLGEAIGWRSTFVVLGLPGLALAAIVRLTLREPVRGRFEKISLTVVTPPIPSVGRTLHMLLRCRTYRLLIIFLALNAFVQFGLLQWWPSLYARVFGLSLTRTGASLGLAFGTGSLAGVLLGGLLATRAAQSDARIPLLTGALSLAAVLPMAAASLFVASAVTSLLLVSLTQLCWGLLAGPVIGTLYNVTPPQMRAMTGAITILANSVLGMGLGPFCVGVLSDRLTPMFGTEALRYALLAPLGLVPLLVGLVYAATRSLLNDMPESGVQLETSTEDASFNGGASRPILEPGAGE